MAEVDTESLYLDLYDDVADSAEYLQADWKERASLPDELILAALGWCLAAFATGFFNQLGGKAAQAIGARISALVHKPAQPSSDQIIEVLQYLHPYLPLLRNSNEKERRSHEQWVSAELERHSFTGPAAQELAKKIMDHLREAGSPS